MKRTFALLSAAAVLLAACSSGGGTGNSGLDYSKAIFQNAFKKGSATPPVNPLVGVNRSQLADLPSPLVFSHLETAGSYALLLLAADRDGTQTFQTIDKVSVSFQSGMLVATRGLGEDLMSSDVSEALIALKQADGDQYKRIHRMLDGEDHTIASEFACVMSSAGREQIEIIEQKHATNHVTERCQNETVSFENEFWLSLSGDVIWQSRQWVGPKVGYMDVELLKE